MYNGFIERNQHSNQNNETTKSIISFNLLNDYFIHVSNAFSQNAGIYLELNQTVATNYTSDADNCPKSTINSECICRNCILPSSASPLNNNNYVGFDLSAHCTSIIRLRNNLVVGIPKNTIRVTYTGYKICYYSNNGHSVASVSGLSNFSYPIVALKVVQYNISSQKENRTLSILILAHELAHSFNVSHHSAISGVNCIMSSGAGSETKYDIDPNDYSSYWCQNCIEILKSNINRIN